MKKTSWTVVSKPDVTEDRPDALADALAKAAARARTDSPTADAKPAKKPGSLRLGRGAEVAILLAALAAAGHAQGSISEVLAKHWKISGEFTLAVAQAMPQENYSFRPVPEEMSFGQLMAHIGLADLGACANASGLARPDLPPKIAEWSKAQQKVEVDRDTAVGFLTDTFAFCNKAVANVPADRMEKVVGPANRNLTGYEWLWSYFTHTAHHRGQAEVYLRLKGIKPPTYVF